MRTILWLGNGPVRALGGAAILCTGLLGCSGIAHQTPSVIQHVPAAEDHTTAQAYYQQAEEARAEADAFERRAESLGQYADPKGFVRSGLMSAAQAHRAKARSLDELAAIQKGQPNTASR